MASQNVGLRVIAVENPSPDGTCDVVFVHGLDGDPVKTWAHDPKNDPESSFPRLLAADLPSARVWALGYPAEKFGGEYARAMSIEDRAKSVLANLAAQGFGTRRIVFIAHSLGGLLVKQMLRFAGEQGADERWRRIGEAVLGVVFLATPHAGSELANVAVALRSVLGTSVATSSLEQYSAQLLDLREWYSEFSIRNAIETAAFAETRPSKFHGVSFGIVVTKESAWPGGTAKTIAIDNVDHFQIAQPPTREATVYKDVLSSLRLWLARDNDPSQVPLEFETDESDSDELSRFLFRTRRVPLFGRDDDLLELQKFLDDPRTFTWCAVTGPGGSGKSRLALELCLQVPPKWRAGFLKRWTSTEFYAWTPNRPTLVVIDYVSARAKDVGAMVRELENRRSTLPFPVRLVLVERDAEGPWVREFVGAGEDRRTTKRGQYVSFPAESLTPPNDPYDDIIRLCTLAVKPLTAEALWDCMLSVFDLAAPSGAIALNNAGRKQQLLSQLAEIDPKRRPLFAAFFADAIAADPNRIEWDTETLVESVLRREQENFWKPNGVTDLELDILTLATLVGGVDCDCPYLPPAAHDPMQCSAERYAIASGRRVSESFSPLEPDMVGEIFVLNRLRASSKLSQNEMCDRAWKSDPLEMSAFFSRAARDFPDHPALWSLGRSPRTATLRERYMWLRMAAEDLLPMCAAKSLSVESREHALAWYDAFWNSYREVLALSSAGAADQRDAELFALALGRLGYSLSVTGEVERGMVVFDEVLKRFGEAAEAALREEVGRALFNKGVSLSTLDRFADAIAIYDEVVTRYGAAAEPALREEAARALVNKGVSLSTLDRLEDAIAVFDEIVTRFGAAAEEALREQVARALLQKGITLEKLHRSEDAITAYGELVTRFGAAAEPALPELVAQALLYRGLTLFELDRSEDAIAVYDELMTRFGAAAEPALRVRAARGLFSKGITLGKLDRFGDALAAYDELVTRFGSAAEPALCELIALALVQKGMTLTELYYCDDAIAVFEEVVTRFGAAAEPTLLEQVARALVNKGVALGQLDRYEDALVLYDDVVTRFGAATEPALCDQVAAGLSQKGIALAQLDRPEDAIAVCDELAVRFGVAARPHLRTFIEAITSMRAQRHTRGQSV